MDEVPPQTGTLDAAKAKVASSILDEANEHLVRATIRAQEEAEAFRLLVETVKEYAICVLDGEGYIKTWNAGAERIRGYTADEIIGQHFSVLYPPAAISSGKCQKELDIAAREGRFEEEGIRVRKDGSEFLAHVVITSLRNDADRVIGFGEVTRDLTDRVRMEREGVERARAAQAQRTKEEFLAIMGHELRNPLTPMVTAVHMLRLRGGRDSERLIDILDRQLNHMKRLVDDLLDVSRVRLEELNLAPTAVAVDELLACAVDVAMPLIEAKKHRLVLDVSASDLFVSVDVARMTQVFGNLLTNSAKYTEPGGEIRLHAFAENARVVVTIEDTGIGIAPELMPHIFELFAQGRQGLERQLGGLGIGLAVAERFVTAHGGEIAAESEGPGRGSRFTVRLPRVPSSKAPRAKSLPGGTRASAGRRVMIVDDNEDSCEVIAGFLEEIGHETQVAHDGPHALAIVEAFAPDVVLLDIGLPGMDGFEVVRRMRELPAGRSIPIIALSGYATVSDRRRALGAGCTEHIAKPVALDVLERVVERTDGR